MLTSQQLIEAGIKPGQTFGKCIKCSTIEEALTLWNNSEESKPKEKKEKQDWTDTVWEWLCEHSHFQGMMSREQFGIASKSEKKRWLESGSVIINGQKLKPEDIIPNRIHSLVFFPSGNKITML